MPSQEQTLVDLYIDWVSSYTRNLERQQDLPYIIEHVTGGDGGGVVDGVVEMAEAVDDAEVLI